MVYLPKFLLSFPIGMFYTLTPFPQPPIFPLMKTRALLFAGIVAGLLSSPAKATTHTNLLETFDTCSGKWSSSTGFNLTGWEKTSGSTYSGEGGARIGTSSAAAVLTSPVIPIMNPGTESTMSLRLQAAAYSGQAGSLLLMAVDSTSGVTNKTWTTDLTSHTSTDAVALDDSNNNYWFDFSFTATNSFRLVFTSARTSGNATKRVLLGYLLVTENLPVLSTPANLALDGAAGENDFTVAWDSVANAQGYSVKLLDSTGENELDAASCSSSETRTSFSGLTSSTHYIVSVVALGNHTTTDDSAAATLPVETAASAIAAPTLVVAETQWVAGVAGTSAVSATLAGGESCAFASVEMSDGSSATVDNGILTWTPSASTTASSVTVTFHVTYDSDGWDVSESLSVAATPAPSAPDIRSFNVSHRSFDVSWSASAGGPVVEYKVRAWSGRATPDDNMGSASENFAAYMADGTVPAGWIFKNSRAHYNYEEAPVDFKGGSSSVTYWIGSPDFGGTISSFSFHLRKVSAVTGTFTVYGSTGSTNEADWVEIKTLSDGAVATGSYSVDALENGDPLASAGFSRLFFRTVKTAGNFAFGTFSVSGVNWPAADFLEDWGGAKVSVGMETSQTFLNPVPGTVNYVEVTAIGPSGLTATTIASVPVPRPSTVISVW